MVQQSSVHRHSSVVTLHLHVGDQVHALSQVAPDFIILKTPSPLPPGAATIVMDVDGEVRRWDVTLLGTDGEMEIVAIKGD